MQVGTKPKPQKADPKRDRSEHSQKTCQALQHVAAQGFEQVVHQHFPPSTPAGQFADGPAGVLCNITDQNREISRGTVPPVHRTGGAAAGGSIADHDGLSGVTFNYQWLLVEAGSNETNIVGKEVRTHPEND